MRNHYRYMYSASPSAKYSNHMVIGLKLSKIWSRAKIPLASHFVFQHLAWTLIAIQSLEGGI